jgi:hypothetical protein
MSYQDIFLRNPRVVLFNTTFNNISVILWRSVLLMKETRVPLTCDGFELANLVVIVTESMGSYKSSYHTITTTTSISLEIRVSLARYNDVNSKMYHHRCFDTCLLSNDEELS